MGIFHCANQSPTWSPTGSIYLDLSTRDYTDRFGAGLRPVCDRSETYAQVCDQVADQVGDNIGWLAAWCNGNYVGLIKEVNEHRAR